MDAARAATASSCCRIRPTTAIAFTESQDGNIVRVDRVTGETLGIRPVAAHGEPAARFHWDTPLALSPHDPKVVYAGANRLYRSTDRGLTWTPISPDLSKNQNRDEIETMGVKNSDIRIARNDGIVAWGTIVSFAESAKRAGVLYTGSDDGNLHVSRDGGKDWASVSDRIPNLPKETFVSEVVPSRFDEAHRLRDVRRPSQQRLRDLHLREHRLRPELALDLRRT